MPESVDAQSLTFCSGGRTASEVIITRLKSAIGHQPLSDATYAQLPASDRVCEVQGSGDTPEPPQ